VGTFKGITEQIHTMLDADSCRAAFGPGLVSGDVAKAAGLACRLADCYGSLIALGREATGVKVPDAWAPAYLAFADLVKATVQQIRQFSATLSAQVPEFVVGRRPARSLSLTVIRIDTRAFGEAIEKVRLALK
jgi:hypothetical protein